VFLFSPLLRKSFVAGETAEYTAVVVAEADTPDAALTLSVSNEAGDTWTASDSLGLLPAGRHSLNYAVDVGCFAPGAYKVAARLGEKHSAALDLVVGPAAPRTHFRLAGWLDKPPKGALDVRRLSAFLGLNTLLLPDRSGWGSEGTLPMDAVFAATSRGLRAQADARPMEAGLLTPQLARDADLLVAGGLEWLNACAASGASQGRLMPERDLANPEVVRGVLHRIHQRLQAERRFRSCAGVLLTDEALLARSGGEGANPFDAPGPLAAYKRLFSVKDVPWQQGAQRWDDWFPFVMFRASILGEALSQWAAAARAASPDALVTSLLHSPTLLADGAYPPLQAKGLPIITTTASLNGPAGMMMPAIAADLQRMGNLDKRLWFMPEIADDADLDEIRAAIFLAMARKADGIVYPKGVDYALDRPGIGPGSLDVQASISSVNHTLTRLGDMLLALEKPRDDVAILYSVTEHIARVGRDPVKDPEATAYPWTLIAAHDACLLAHFPATFVTEEELLGAQRVSAKVILVVGLNRLRPEVKGALEQHIAAGGVVVTDSTTKAVIDGARPLGIEFPDIHQYDAEAAKKPPDEKSDPLLARRDVVVQGKLLYPLLAPLRTELKLHVERDYTTADPDMVVCDQRCGAGRYVFLVNNTQRPDFCRGLKWELAAAQTRLTLRAGTYAVYEAVEGKRVYPMRDKGHPTLALVLPPGALRIFALLPEPIAGVSITQASHSRAGLALAAKVCGESSLFGARGINAAIPIEITIADPTGRERLRVFRAHSPKGYQETLPVARTDQAGTWTVTVRELLSGQKETRPFRMSRGAIAWASRATRPLVATDGERITALLRSSKPLAVVVGTEDEAAKAEPLAAALRTPARAVEVKLAAELAKPRKLGAAEAATYVSAAPGNAPTPDLRDDAILLGEAATHPLIQFVHNTGVLPRIVTPDFPGPGGALLAHVLSAFEPGGETVVASASDAAGVDAAVQALLGVARGAVPRVAWRALSAERELAAKPRPPAKLQRLAPVWRYRGSDAPTSIAMPLQGTDVTAGFYDGTVFSFNNLGRENWRRRCSTRVRAVARSLDGVWAAIASFPELMLLSAQGRLQFAAVMEQAYYRADHTAIALSPDGTLTVAGTRRGALIAYDLQGNKVFGFGEADADEKKEGWQSRLGSVNDLTVAPRTVVFIAGGELATVALDPKGQELWASADLNRVTSVAASFGEEQTVAVASRTGAIACVTGGTILWRNQADGPVASVCFRGDTQEVLAASLDGTLACYDKNGKAAWTRRSPVGFRFVASSLDGNLIAAAELTGRVVILNKAGQDFAETEQLDGAIRAMAFSLDGERLVVGTAGGELVAFKLKRAVAEQDEL